MCHFNASYFKTDPKIWLSTQWWPRYSHAASWVKPTNHTQCVYIRLNLVNECIHCLVYILTMIQANNTAMTGKYGNERHFLVDYNKWWTIRIRGINHCLYMYIYGIYRLASCHVQQCVMSWERQVSYITWAALTSRLTNPKQLAWCRAWQCHQPPWSAVSVSLLPLLLPSSSSAFLFFDLCFLWDL